ncbi:MAG TPA: peptidylprolyl isomerase [Chthoniobacterales bacterium]
MIFLRHALLIAFLGLPLSAHAQNVPPKATATIPDATLYRGAAAEVVDLSSYFTDPDTTGVRLTTVLGKIDLALYDKDTPTTVANFLKYIDNGRYKITDPITGDPAPIFFHRSVSNFVIQTGGFLATASPAIPGAVRPTPVETYPAIQNEFHFSNTRGTIAMAKLGNDPNSATSQWFINLADNSANLDSQNGGFTVFGRVLGDGMQVADAIAALPIFNFGPPFDNLPLRDYTNNDFSQGKAASPANTVTIPDISRTAAVTFTATSDHPALAKVLISGTNLLVTPKALGTAQITVTATDLDGATVSQSFSVNIIGNPVHLANISTRLVVGTRDDALIGGFIVRGAGTKRVAIRALGPSLASAGLTNVLADPKLELHDSHGNILASNDNWKDSANEQDIADVGLAPENPNEAVILTSLPASAVGSDYTAIVRGADGNGGTGLVEIYDLGSGPGSSVLNISTRGSVQHGDDVMIGGFIVFGDGSQDVLVRALGPSLTGAGVAGALSNPTLTLNDVNGNQIDFNDDWEKSPDADKIRASTIPPTNPKEAAIVQTLAPGNYTAIVRGAGNATGIALVEVYALATP